MTNGTMTPDEALNIVIRANTRLTELANDANEDARIRRIRADEVIIETFAQLLPLLPREIAELAKTTIAMDEAIWRQ